jgi:hypothetical protein
VVHQRCVRAFRDGRHGLPPDGLQKPTAIGLKTFLALSRRAEELIVSLEKRNRFPRIGTRTYNTSVQRARVRPGARLLSVGQRGAKRRFRSPSGAQFDEEFDEVFAGIATWPWDDNRTTLDRIRTRSLSVSA